MARVLIVEDEAPMRQGLRDNLEIEGYQVDDAADGEEGLRKMAANDYDLVILDVMLPRLPGFDVLKEARRRGLTVPVIMLTAKGEEVDRVVGLELGADDYVTKPFGLRELLARVRAVLRRASAPAAPVPGPVRVGALEVDFGASTARRGTRGVEMTARELEVLRFLWQHRGQVVGRDQLLENVWGYAESPTTRTVDNFILRLRRKLEEDPAHPRHLLTVHGTGYKLIP